MLTLTQVSPAPFYIQPSQSVLKSDFGFGFE